jgi:hypothetical protein
MQSQRGISEMLQEFAWPEIERLYPVADEDDEEGAGDRLLDNLIFMQDGAPPHFGGLRWLDDHFPERWMGRGTRAYPAPYPWPPRSPDLTPMDFYLWGYVKTRVYRDKMSYANSSELVDAIEREMRAIPVETSRKAVTEGYKNRLQACVLAHGGHIEVE